MAILWYPIYRATPTVWPCYLSCLPEMRDKATIVAKPARPENAESP